MANTIKINIFTGKSEGVHGDRHTGRTTAQAFKYIARALDSPGLKFKVKDHYPEPKAHRRLLRFICDIVQKENLKGFIVNPAELSIVYNPWDEVEKEITVGGYTYILSPKYEEES